VVECFPYKYKALNSNPNTAKTATKNPLAGVEEPSIVKEEEC
jgi:hypothetical protein